MLNPWRRPRTSCRTIFAYRCVSPTHIFSPLPIPSIPPAFTPGTLSRKKEPILQDATDVVKNRLLPPATHVTTLILSTRLSPFPNPPSLWRIKGGRSAIHTLLSARHFSLAHVFSYHIQPHLLTTSTNAVTYLTIIHSVPRDLGTRLRTAAV